MEGFTYFCLWTPPPFCSDLKCPASKFPNPVAFSGVTPGVPDGQVAQTLPAGTCACSVTTPLFISLTGASFWSFSDALAASAAHTMAGKFTFKLGYRISDTQVGEVERKRGGM